MKDKAPYPSMAPDKPVVRSRILLLLSALFVAFAGFTFASDAPGISVTVKDDGQVCVVRTRSMNCAALSTFLSRDLGVSRSAAVTVSPEGCGEGSAARAHAVANVLKEAGFTNLVVVGFLSEPNKTCTP